MKTKIFLAVTAAFFMFSGSAFALHDGGVAHCDACHSMHNSADNPRNANATNAPSLMKGSDASSTCLNCHAGDGSSYHNSLTTVGNGVSQGGDFFWVLASSAYDFPAWGGGPSFPNNPDNTGHNVIAADFGLAVDGTNVLAPGGIMPSNTLFCTSCHDPHGRIDGGTAAGAAPISGSGSYGDAAPVDGSVLGNFRLLGDDGYKLINSDAPIAASVNAGYQQPGGYGNSTDYGSGMSGWCLSCHTLYNAGNMHTVDDIVPAAYNSYKATGDYTGLQADAYDSMVPFERNVAATQLVPGGAFGALGTSTVACISCHRAHASAFDNAIRWDSTHEMLHQSGILNETTTTILAGGAIPYYRDGAAFDPDVEYGVYQRSLCNKCHVKD